MATQKSLLEGGAPIPPSIPAELIEGEYRKLRMAFEPATAAIVGASSDPKKFGGRALKFCLERGFRGVLYPVNASSDEVQGVRAYRSIADLPQAPDIAVIAVPAPQVLEALVAAGERGAGIAIVYGAMFAESGAEGRARQQELVAVARRHGMRLIGPNCMGVISLRSGFVASFTTAPEHHNGNGWPDQGSVSVVSQSGAVGIQIFAQLRDRGLGLANWISTGNQADIDVGDCIAYFAEDDTTRTIAVYMEDASRGLKLVQALERARMARKPVVILKVGTTPEGGFAAAGHTAAMYVEDRVIDDLFRQYGVLRARSVNELIDLVAACNSAVMPDSPEVAAISVSGGGAVMIADAAARNGLVLPEFDLRSLQALKETNSFVNDRNPIDISAPSMSDMAITAGHLEFGLAQPMPTMVGYISHIPLVPRTRKEIMPRLLALAKKHPHKLIAIAMNADAQDRKELVKSGIAVFDDPVVAIESVAKLVRAGQAFTRPGLAPVAGPPFGSIGIGEAAALLAEYGIAMVREQGLATADDAVDFQRNNSGPVALKLSAPALHHRTEIDGVRLGLDNAASVRQAFDALASIGSEQLARHPELQIVGCPMIAGGVEVHIGVRNDPYFGPLVFLGSGGILVELIDDTVFRKVPICHNDALAMVTAIKADKLLGRWRGRPARDRKALVAALLALSRLATDRRAVFAAIEINPLFVLPGRAGVIGADLVVDSAAPGAHP